MGDSLFATLPEQRAPIRIEAGGIAVERCPKCKGRGTVRESWFTGGYQPDRLSRPCPKCKGGKWVVAQVERDGGDA